MTPSPIRAEYQRVPREMAASTTARPAMNRAIRTMSPAVPSRLAMRLTMSPASSGVMTRMTEEPTTSSTNQVSSRRYGRAMPRMRRTVPLGSSRAVTDGSRRKDRIAAMEVMGPLTSMPPPLPTGQHPCRAGCSWRSLPGPSDGSAPADQLRQPAGLGGALGRVLDLRVVADGGAHQRRGLPAGADRSGGDRGDQ